VRGSGQSVGASGWARERGDGGRGQASVKCSACAVAAVLTTGATRAATTTAATTTAATTASRRWREEAEVQASVQRSSGGRCVASAHPARHGRGGAPQGSGRGWWREAGGSAGGAAFIRCAAGRAGLCWRAAAEPRHHEHASLVLGIEHCTLHDVDGYCRVPACPAFGRPTSDAPLCSTERTATPCAFLASLLLHTRRSSRASFARLPHHAAKRNSAQARHRM